VPFRDLGTVSGDSLIDGVRRHICLTLRATHESWFPDFMDVPGRLAAE
jgi:hypothetical protein